MANPTTPAVDGALLARLEERPWLADGGLETWLLFQQGVDLPDFAAFPLLETPHGRAHLDTYLEGFLDVAEPHGVGLVVDTPTWRASPDWAARLGYDVAALRELHDRAVAWARDAAGSRPRVPTLVNGVMGPRGDGYVVGEVMGEQQAEDYHALQAAAFASAGVDLVTAVTMTYVAEAVGVVRAASAAELPAVVSFTVETDGHLPDGTPLGRAVAALDAATDGAAAYLMVNCAHPTHFVDALRTGEPWVGRIRGVRANASRSSHAELDEAEELDRGDPAELAEEYAALRDLLPGLRVVGGCCGTDAEHVAAIADRLLTGS